jgi:hypothetical protein
MTVIKTVILTIVFFVATISFCAAKKIDLPIERVKIDPLEFNAVTGVEVKPQLRSGLEGYTFEYLWTLNGDENLYEFSSKFPGELLKRGDKLTVEITPFNYEGVRRAPAIIPDMVVVNASPDIISEPTQEIIDNTYRYKVKGADPDGDHLTFSLSEGPAGMIIDPQSGLLTWSIDPELAGNAAVSIVVEDGFGGRVEQNFEMNLSFEPKGKAK